MMGEERIGGPDDALPDGDGMGTVSTTYPTQEEASPKHDSDDTSPKNDLSAVVISFANEYTARDKENRRQQKIDGCWIKAGTILVAIYTVITGFLWWATVKNFRADQRAWVGIAEVINEPLIPDAEVHFDFVAQNFGKTPAIRLTGKTANEVIPKGQTFIPVYKSNAINIASHASIFPGVKFRTRTHTKKLTQQQVDVIKTEEKRMYLYGQFEYEDIFHQSHCTQYCLFVAPDLQRMFTCPFYNDVTDAKCQYDNYQ